MCIRDRSVEGMAEACEALGVPVTGGNVSLYNETGGEPVYPTPAIGAVGVIDDVSRAIPPGFREPGQKIGIIGRILGDEQSIDVYKRQDFNSPDKRYHW